MRSDQTSPPSSTTKSPRIAWVVILRFFVMALLLMAVLFLAAGKLDWWEGWAYVIQAFLVIVFSRGILILKNPGPGAGAGGSRKERERQAVGPYPDADNVRFPPCGVLDRLRPR